MGFFNKLRQKKQEEGLRRDVEQAVDRVQKCISVLLETADQLGEMGVKTDNGVNIGVQCRYDLISYAFCVAEADQNIEESELSSIQYFLGMEIDDRMIKEFQELDKKLTKAYLKTIPDSISTLARAYKENNVDPSVLLNHFKVIYEELGTIIAGSDSNISDEELKVVLSYQKMIDDFTATL